MQLGRKLHQHECLFSKLFFLNGKSLECIYVMKISRCRAVWVTGGILITAPVNNE